MLLSNEKIKKKYEIVIVDDGCPEQSGHHAKKFSIKNKKIKVIFHKKNLGYGAAIKTGLKIVTTSGSSRQMVTLNMM